MYVVAMLALKVMVMVMVTVQGMALAAGADLFVSRRNDDEDYCSETRDQIRRHVETTRNAQ